MILFVTFSVEFVLKHLALYPMGYWSDSWNKLDGGIVVVGYAATMNVLLLLQLSIHLAKHTICFDMLHWRSYLQFVPGVGEYPAIRVLRAIRPLR